MYNMYIGKGSMSVFNAAGSVPKLATTMSLSLFEPQALSHHPFYIAQRERYTDTS